MKHPLMSKAIMQVTHHSKAVSNYHSRALRRAISRMQSFCRQICRTLCQAPIDFMQELAVFWQNCRSLKFPDQGQPPKRLLFNKVI